MTALQQVHNPRVRLRPKHSDEDLAAIYANPWSHIPGFQDHELRIASTIALAKWFKDDVNIVADLSCGDAQITNGILEWSSPNVVLGDYGPGYDLQGPIEETIDKIEYVDLFICSETLEHLDDPDAVLRKIRSKTRYLIASSPIGEYDPSHNAEHYWGWGLGAFEQMLNDAAFDKVALVIVETPPPYLYDYQIWACQ